MAKDNYTLQTKWTVSRRRDESYGWNVCSLYVDGKKTGWCDGGGYDMVGTVVGLWMQTEFAPELLGLRREFYGLTYHDPTYDPGTAVIDGQTVAEREVAGLSLGLERYQAFYSASSRLPSERHTVPQLDGGCGIESMWRVLEALGYAIVERPIPGRERHFEVTRTLPATPQAGPA